MVNLWFYLWVNLRNICWNIYENSSVEIVDLPINSMGRSIYNGMGWSIYGNGNRMDFRWCFGPFSSLIYPLIAWWFSTYIYIYPGWWFGTMEFWMTFHMGKLHFMVILVVIHGEFTNQFMGVWIGNSLWYDFRYIGNNHPNWRTPSFFRAVGLNHQPVWIFVGFRQCGAPLRPRNRDKLGAT